MEKKSIISQIKILLFILLIVILVFMGGKYIHDIDNQKEGTGESISPKYQYHCVFITENNSDPFWNSIYEGAKEEGKEKDIYVEKYGESLALNYTPEENMEMAIASGVDAVIVEGRESPEMTQLIDLAQDKGIVVTTIYTDNVNSKRQSFIGVNNFQMGYALCSAAYQYLESDQEKIMVVYEDENKKSQDNTMLNTGMKKYLDERKSNVDLSAQLIAGNETYDTQEKIRSLLKNEATRPRVLICTNMIQTQCAYQTVVDLNCVGDVNIIGFYISDTIQEGLKKDIIQAVMVVDTKQMGEKAVDSIREYLDYGYASDYVSVPAEIIDGESMEGEKEAQKAEK